jgi:hypothetical protein
MEGGVRCTLGSASGLPQRRSGIALAGTCFRGQRAFCVAVAPPRQCANGHEMPESHLFCSVCGSEELEKSEELSDFSATQSDSRTGLAHKIGKARILLTAVIAVCVLGLGLGLGLTGGNSSSTSAAEASSTPTTASSSPMTGATTIDQMCNNIEGGVEFSALTYDENLAALAACNIPNTSSLAIDTAAPDVCTNLNEGTSVDQQLYVLETELSGSGIQFPDDAASFVVAAAVHYDCPGDESEVQAAS